MNKAGDNINQKKLLGSHKRSDIEKYREAIREEAIRIWTTTWFAKHSEKWRETTKASIESIVFHENHQEDYIHILERCIGSLENKSVLNIGCGVGGFEVAVWKRGAEPVGVDIDKRTIKIAKIRSSGYAEKGISLIVCDARRLPFRIDCFDVVVSIGVLEHVKKNHHKDFVGNMVRVLKPKGFLYIIAGSNKWTFYDTHYRLLFINLLPSILAKYYLRLLRPGCSFHTEYVSPREVIRLVKPHVSYIKKVWAEMVAYSLRKREHFPLPDLFMNGCIKTIRKFHLDCIMIPIAKVLESLSMEMSIWLLAQKIIVKRQIS